MFDIKKRLSLAFLGEGWGDCYLDFRPALIKELKEIEALAQQGNGNKDQAKAVTQGLDFIKDKFLGGKALSNGKLVDVEAKDLVEFPLDIIVKIFELFVGDVPEKKVMSFGNQSEE